LDLGNYSRKGLLRDVLIGVGLFVPFILLGMGGIVGGMALLQYTPPAPTGQLPTWATLFTIIIWPIIWTFSEDNTYIGYCLPRIEVLTGRKKWLAVGIVWLFLSVQHVFTPTGLAWQTVVSWFVALIPFTALYCWLWWRLRRLLPIMVGHVLADLVSVLLSVYLLG
jgi:membrane protease YdiL (CAAX protease family)